MPTLAVGTALALATLCLGSLPVWASPGDLDYRFGGGDGWAHAGFSRLDGRPAEDRGENLIVQPDGRIIVLGVSYEDRLPRMAMIRFLPDGSPDPAFGAHHSGRRIITGPGIEPGSTWPADIALLPDGKIVVAGTSRTWPLIVFRYDSKGDLDRSFVDRGWVTPSSPDFVEDAVIAAQPNGKVLIGGTAPVAGSLFDFVLVRLLQDGRLDASFGLDGVTTVDVGGRTNGLGDLIIGRRGRIIAGGTVVRTLPPPPGSPDDINQATMVVVRLLEDGTVDSRFGRGGRTIVRFFPGVDDQYKSFHLSSIAAQSDGSLVLGGGGYLPNGGRVAVFGRLRRNGELDKRFGTRGRLIPQIIPKIDGVADLIIDGLDRIYASVWVQQRGAPHSEAGVLRVLPDGVLDQRFGSNGVAAVGLRRETDPRDLDLTQGHLVLGGSALGGKRWGWDFALFAFRV